MLFVIGLIGVIRNSSFPQPARMEWDKYGKAIVVFFVSRSFHAWISVRVLYLEPTI